MFKKHPRNRGGNLEGENPFWISFSDLMTALMTLFLALMAVTIVVVSQSIPKSIQQEADRAEEIKIVMGILESESEPYEKVKVDAVNHRIDLGDIIYFESNSSQISAEQASFLRGYIPVLLQVKNSPKGKWIKRYIIEGFTDVDGSYAYNLQLSTDRSRSVICALVADRFSGNELSEIALKDVQRYFSLGGFSSYSIRSSKDLSRRVEIQVEFWNTDDLEQRDAPLLLNDEFGVCR